MTREEAIDRLIEAKKGYKVYLTDEAVDIAIKALEQEPSEDMTTAYLMGYYADKEPCDDAISRQAMFNILLKYTLGESRIAEELNALPSVNPQPNKGHWIQTNEFFINQDGQFIYKFICSECKSLSYFRKSNKKAIGADVCPNCGAKMEVEE